MAQPKGYDSTVARIAGNILAGVFETDRLVGIGDGHHNETMTGIVRGAVKVARTIVAETQRSESGESQ